jgi:hypothetical protein
MTNFTREATTEEIAVYEIVNKYMMEISDEEYETALEKIADYVYEWQTAERKKFYNRLRGLAKKIGVSVKDLETWYCIDD